MIRKIDLLALGAAACIAATPAGAQVNGTVNVEGFVIPLCFAGTLVGADDVFDLGVLTNTASGLLRTDLSAPPKTLAGAFCSGMSTISISATPLVSQTNTSNPPSGFSRTVDYTATAAGWTNTPATFTTGTATNSGAVQSQPLAFTGDIIVSIDNFSTGGGQALRLVADPAYQGEIVVTLAAVN